jgi:hypothetical protein
MRRSQGRMMELWMTKELRISRDLDTRIHTFGGISCWVDGGIEAGMNRTMCD